MVEDVPNEDVHVTDLNSLGGEMFAEQAGVLTTNIPRRAQVFVGE